MQIYLPIAELSLDWREVRLAVRQTADILHRYDLLERPDHERLVALVRDEAELAPAEARRRLSLPPSGPLILFAGLIEPYKGLVDLVGAFGALAPDWPAARLVVAGRPNMTLEPVMDRLTAAGLTDRVHLDLRFLPQRDLAAYLCAQSGISALKKKTIAPVETMNSLKETTQWLKNGTR